jgi:putative membrane protein
MEIVTVTLSELPSFLAYMATGLVLTFFYVVIYIWVTPHPEIKLIRENNVAASFAFMGSLIGFCMPLASAIANSVSLMDCAIWGSIALIVQIAIFYLVGLPIPKISERIEKEELAAGIWLGSASFAGGLLNAASMTS